MIHNEHYHCDYNYHAIVIIRLYLSLCIIILKYS